MGAHHGLGFATAWRPTALRLHKHRVPSIAWMPPRRSHWEPTTAWKPITLEIPPSQDILGWSGCGLAEV